MRQGSLFVIIWSLCLGKKTGLDLVSGFLSPAKELDPDVLNEPHFPPPLASIGMGQAMETMCPGSGAERSQGTAVMWQTRVMS